jgi:streptogramin lyase
LWFVEEQASVSQIGRITTSGSFTEYPVPTRNSRPYWITAGPDGALWFTEYTVNKIGRITTSGAITEYPVPTVNPALNWITAGPDGALWFAENSGNKIGRITTAGAVTEYPVPTPSGGPLAITTGPDGALWFTEQYSGKIGRITTSGLITEFLAAAGSRPVGMAPGPGHALWFVLEDSNAIGSAPACALGLSASFAGTTLTTDFDLGVAQSGIWSVYAGDTVLLRKEIPAVAPPHQFAVSFGAFPNEANVTVTSALSAAGGETLCSEWTTVSLE